MNKPVLIATPSPETHLETQAVLYPTLRQLVQLLPWNHQRVREHLREQAKHNPFLLHQRSTNPEVLLEDVFPDWYSPAASAPSLQEHLRGQISALNLPFQQREALLYLTQWLSPSGYLEESPQVWAEGSSWSVRELEAVVPHLQSLEPPGIGARSLQECLLLQLQEQPNSLAARLVEDYLEDVANCVGQSTEARQHQELLLLKLQQRFAVHEPVLELPLDLQALEAAISEIQTLEPRPGRNFSYHPASIVTPDLKAEPHTNGWQVSLMYEVSQEFCLDEEAIVKITQSRQTAREKQRLESLLEEARSLLKAVNQWQENLLKVGQFLVNRQQAFLTSKNSLDLVPTPQQLVAQSIGLSDATTSRIVRERYLLIGGQQSRILPLRSLCTPVSVGGRTPKQIQQMIIQLIQQEPPTKPYSDDQLAQLLQMRFGVAIARRTVVKYRKMAGIDSSHIRKLGKSRK
ncbi:RNA polymerase subunit sigma-54 [Scytonema sp. UIC 10036]|uniref:RNA polymerase factor sigma-54 n=1 Tax=Scytonema sp. UIC 10036 TaxID=2304196 RepID=UPI0012DA7FE0|nr:RNA polymerase subunit sigma-54 [Scytonema sp. UIC 10036]MUG91937.1 RNA polymerase subunit sigma-54 [Scytonema sp. UIC 10036]